jgi:hypothetical protein
MSTPKKPNQSSMSQSSERITNPGEAIESLIHTLILCHCMGVLKDSQTNGPLDEKNFVNLAPTVVSQAGRLYLMVIEEINRITREANNPDPSNEELAA